MRALLASGDSGPSLGAFLDAGGYSRMFVDRLIVPQASAVWSADPAAMWAFPVRFLAEFFRNHGMLGFRDRPQWKTVAGGSARYVEALTKPFADRIRVATPVTAVTRLETHVEVTADGETQDFDEVILACHSDQALATLTDATDAEQEILGAIGYQRNEAVLHTDASLLPKRMAARQAWNFHLLAEPKPLSTVTYSMNRLQRLDAPVDFCVTLNLTERIDPAKIIRTIQYAHPVYTEDGVRAQGRHHEINGVNRTRYCGAYWGWGFHEDGAASAGRAIAGLDRIAVPA
jgi:predicted NAD/FAD-binding protein